MWLTSLRTNRAQEGRLPGKSSQEEKNIAAEFGRRLSRLLFRVAFVFEPLSPRLISYYVTQRLEKWKRQELILDYKTRTKRLGKFHYKTQIDLDVNADQINRIPNSWVKKHKKARR